MYIHWFVPIFASIEKNILNYKKNIHNTFLTSPYNISEDFQITFHFNSKHFHPFIHSCNYTWTINNIKSRIKRIHIVKMLPSFLYIFFYFVIYSNICLHDKKSNIGLICVIFGAVKVIIYLWNWVNPCTNKQFRKKIFFLEKVSEGCLFILCLYTLCWYVGTHHVLKR